MLKSSALFPLVAVLSMSAHAAPPPGNADEGKKVHAAHCTSCHTDSVYTRKDRRVTNVQELMQQINACGRQIGVTWSKEQMSNLTKYLNETYYKFK